MVAPRPRTAAVLATRHDHTDKFANMFAPDEGYFGTVLMIEGYPVDDIVHDKDLTWTHWEKTPAALKATPSFPPNTSPKSSTATPSSPANSPKKPILENMDCISNHCPRVYNLRKQSLLSQCHPCLGFEELRPASHGGNPWFHRL